MPVAASPVSVLCAALSDAPALKGVAKVFAGKNKIADSAAPPRIVVFPIEAGYNAPHDNVMALVDVDLKLGARIWGRDLDDAWDLRQRFVQALWQQAIGNTAQPFQATDAQGGYKFDLIDEKWDTSPDTAQQGQELEVVFTVRAAAASKPQLGTGSIDATALHGLQTTLTVALTANAATMTVASTSGFAASGSLSVDGEQITYTGLTATSFTGLTRGVNGTTAAAHAVAATVTQ